MPTLDDERGVLVVRLVYDGPPFSGKTTTLRTLARRLGVEVVTPEERDGRTMYFDWVDYIGGVFEGRRIRCQIVSVPGQRELADRRAHLIDSADAVVLVADSTPEPFAAALRIARELAPTLRQRRPPTGLIVQANKRDAPGALSRQELRERLDRIGPFALTETVATHGDGVREAFVLGVRLAIDRARALAEDGGIPRGRPEIDRPEGLLAAMRNLESKAPPPFATTPPDTATEATDAEKAVSAEAVSAKEAACEEAPSVEAHVVPRTPPVEERPLSPDPQMPSGHIWPPVDGRALLHEVSRLSLVPERTARGDWSGSGGGWRFHSRSGALYDDVAKARLELIAWARLHVSSARVLSPGRALFLADAGEGYTRLWQLVHVEPPLREALIDASGKAPGAVVLALMFATLQLMRARQALLDTGARLPCTLWTIGTDAKRQPVYVGVMFDHAEQPDPDAGLDVAALVRRELGPVLRALAVDRDDYAEIVEGLTVSTDHSLEGDGMRALSAIACEQLPHAAARVP